jgi:phosphatidate cytidylyltransferase
MVFGKGKHLELAEGLFAAVLLPLSAYLGGAGLLAASAVLFFIAVFLLYLFRAGEALPEIVDLMKVVSGVVYLPFLFGHAVLIRSLDNGVAWIFFVVILAFSGDITAFYVGRKWGRRKLMPLVSAGKTVEGTLGLVAGTIAGCLIYRTFFLPELSLSGTVVLAFLGSLLCQLGDLFESAIKRSAHVKDSGFLFPGHGGVLDRLDSLVFMVPFVYYYRALVIS